MAAKRLTQIFPFLLPLRRWQRRLFFYTKMRFDRNKYSKRILEKPLPYDICSISSVLINKNSGWTLVQPLFFTSLSLLIAPQSAP